MIDNVRRWLNSSRDYNKGVAILQLAGGDADLLTVLVKGPNDFRVRRLSEEVIAIYENLKSNKDAIPANIPAAAADNVPADPDKNLPEKQKNHPTTKREDTGAPEPDGTNANPELYAACKQEAGQEYKKVMNLRAVLFSLAKVEDFTNPNMPDKIKAREQMAIDVVTGFQKVSELYDQAEFVKLNGRLPDTEENTTEEFAALPDYLVKDQLDNARKAYNKLKNKEQTPKRIELMQKHEENIKKLEDKWHSLQPQ